MKSMSSIAGLLALVASLGADRPTSLCRAIAEGTAEPPPRWTRSARIDVPKAQVEAIGERLGGSLTALSNTTFGAGGISIRVNILDCRSEADAIRIHEALLKIHRGERDAAFLDGATVVELVVADPRAAKRAPYDLGLRPREETYRVSFRAAPLERCESMSWNRMYNLLLDRGEADRPAAEIERLASDFTFGRVVRLRAVGQGGSKSSWALKPAPEGRSATENDVIAFSMGTLPEFGGVPWAAIEGEVRSEAFAAVPSTRKPGLELLGPTRHWPSDDPALIELAGKIVGGRIGPREKVDALLDALMPGKTYRYGGDVVGSRYGVRAFLGQKVGKCWDFSDAFITLARASGIPCRQVAGWLYGVEGHIWAEALVDGEGWLSVDPTAGMPCGADHVPIMTTEDGEIPLVYASRVRVERVSKR